MQADEIIFYEVGKSEYEEIAWKAVEYGLRSVHFTYNRMRESNLESRIENIGKGKLAEGLLERFAEERNLNIDFKRTKTPFWQPDKGDFLFKGYEWDMKNNFIYCENYSNEDILNFLALVPLDQWVGKYSLQASKAYLFTFMEKPKGRRLFDLNLKSGLAQFELKINRYSKLIITCYATQREFGKFHLCTPRTKFPAGKDCFTSKIGNMGAKVRNLPAFSSLL